MCTFHAIRFNMITIIEWKNCFYHVCVCAMCGFFFRKPIIFLWLSNHLCCWLALKCGWYSWSCSWRWLQHLFYVGDDFLAWWNQALEMLNTLSLCNVYFIDNIIIQWMSVHETGICILNFVPNLETLWRTSSKLVRPCTATRQRQHLICCHFHTKVSFFFFFFLFRFLLQIMNWHYYYY